MYYKIKQIKINKLYAYVFFVIKKHLKLNK